MTSNDELPQHITIEDIFEPHQKERRISEQFPNGTAVLVHDQAKGTIRYYGEVPSLGPGKWLGIELENPIGDSDGSMGGVSYFEAKPRHGLFSSPRDVKLYNEMLTASIIDDVKKKLLESGKKSVIGKGNNLKDAETTWNLLDNYQEQVLIKRALTFESIFGTGTRHVRFENMEDIGVGKDYDGPHLTFPLTLDNVEKMLQCFREGKKLHIKYALDLLSFSKKLLNEDNTLQEITIPEGHRLTIVGDLHGQLDDLFTIFSLNTLPSEDTHYLFNGDLVDRGNNSCEVLFSVLAFKCLYPTRVMINRGNHEARQQNRIMGFEEEVFSKYTGPNGKILLAACQKVFDYFPLCAVIQKKIFVVHGGLFSEDGVRLEHISGISRKREPPIRSEVFENKLFEEMLWSDPRSIVGRQHSMRGAGVEFGQDATYDFLRTNQLALIIRSHECVDEGYEMTHGGRIMTLFSASRYCDTQNNKGAYLTMGPDLQPEIQQYFATPIVESSWGKSNVENGDLKASMDDNSRIQKALEDDSIKMIIVSILDKKHSLYYYYTCVDKENKGKVTLDQWAEGLKTILKVDLPYSTLAHRLVDLDEDGKVDFVKFLDKYKVEIRNVDATWQNKVIDSICEKMYIALKGKGSRVEDAFHLFDIDGGGTIEYEEFITTLKTLDAGLTESQIYELMRGLDADCDSKIDFEEFKNRFDLVFTGVVEREVELSVKTLASEDKDILIKIGDALVRGGEDLKAVFNKLDQESPLLEGNITIEQFVTLARQLGISEVDASNQKLMEIATYVDVDDSGCINYNEFKSAFKVTDIYRNKSIEELDKEDKTWCARIINQISNFLFQYRLELGSIFRAFDQDNSGVISTEEFINGIMKLNKVTNMQLTEEQASILMKAIDVNGDGQLSYHEFLQAFKVVSI